MLINFLSSFSFQSIQTNSENSFTSPPKHIVKNLGNIGQSGHEPNNVKSPGMKEFNIQEKICAPGLI